MSTSGTFTVYSNASSPISGHVSHKNDANEAIYFTNLAKGDTSSKGTRLSGAGTHDSWYWVISIGGASDVKGSFGCAMYADDTGRNATITIGDGQITIKPPVSSSCGPTDL